MGKQIYETILPSEVTGVNIMRSNVADNYDLEMWEDLGQLRTVFQELVTTNTLVTVATITPCERLGITFKFDTERIRCVAQLHEFSIPGRISTNRREENQLDGVVRDFPWLESTDGLMHHDVSNQGEGGLPPTRVDKKDDHVNKLTEGLQHYDIVADQGDTASLPTRIDGSNVPAEHIMETHEEHTRQTDLQETWLSGKRGTTRGAR